MKGVEVVHAAATEATDVWRSDKRLMTWLRSRFGEFTIDCAASDATIAPRYITKAQNALVTPWGKPEDRRFCNPPYSLGDEFVPIGASQDNGVAGGTCMLVPARTDTAWFQDTARQWNRIELLKGRLQFWLTEDELAVINAARKVAGKKPLSHENTAPFPSALLISGFGYTGHVIECVDWRALAGIQVRGRRKRAKAA